MSDQRTHFLGSACVMAMVIVLVVATVIAVLTTKPLIQHADCAPERITLVAALRDVAGDRLQVPVIFRGSFVETNDRPHWTEVLL